VVLDGFGFWAFSFSLCFLEKKIKPAAPHQAHWTATINFDGKMSECDLDLCQMWFLRGKMMIKQGIWK